jgi:hypothetical protein
VQSYVGYTGEVPVSEPIKQKFDEKSLPDAEINPLLNPLLAANMGRWAEVYFTTPPEKRDQAIHELLRELANDPAAQPSTQVVDIERAKEKKMTRSPETSGVLVCRACGHSNRTGQKFCGMCGITLPAVAEQPEERSIGSALLSQAPISQAIGQSRIEQGKADKTPINHAKFDQAKFDQAKANQPNTQFPASSASSARGDTQASSVPGAARPASTSRNNEDDTASRLRKRLSDLDLPSFAVASESGPYRYRVYVGLLIAILLAALAYMAWRRTNLLSQSGARHPGLTQAVPADQTPPTNPARQSAAGPTTKPVVPQTTPSAPSAQVAENPQPSRPSANRQMTPPPAQAAPAPQHSSVIASGQSGAEELAIAEKYLHGSARSARDSGAAAQWLWKAVGKGNLAATMELSDLYLRGDGVEKSCDQGHLLLDAAARKGVAAAAYRLHNLQAFGCE